MGEAGVITEVREMAERGSVADWSPDPGQESGNMWVQRLTEALCLATQADQVVAGQRSLEGSWQELAVALADAASPCCSDWSDLAALVFQTPTSAHGTHADTRTGITNFLADQYGLGPVLLVREMLPGGNLAVVLALRQTGKPPFSEKEVRIAQALMELLRERLSLDEPPLLLHVRLLTQIAQVGGSNPDLTSTLRFALRELARHCPGCWASVWLVEGANADTLRLEAYSDPMLSTIGRRTALRTSSLGEALPLVGQRQLNVRESPFAPVLQRRHIVYLERLAEQPWEMLRQWANVGFQKCAAVPLFVGQEKIGILLMLSSRAAGFTKDQVHLAATVAELLGPIIACHRLTGQLSQAYEQLQKAQQQLVCAEKMRALGELASGMAHDFNNALCGTLGFIELALKEPQLPSAVEELLRMARTCALDAAATVRRVQDFARWDRSLQNAEVVQVNDLVRQVVELTKPRWHNTARADSRTIEVNLSLQAQTPVMANPSELREVLTNIVLNAVDAMPEGGQIHIATSDDGTWVILRVSDTGIGMTPEVQQRIFEPFFTTKKERGTGLGLSVSYAIIKRHGGEISVASTLGRGSTFTIRLPALRVLQTDVPRGESFPTLTSAVRTGLRILVIDDEPHVLTFLRQCLLHLGHQPDTHTDPEQALEQFRRQPYEVVITDLGMPKLDGYQVSALVNQMAPNVPVILLTGWGEQLRQGESFPAGVRHVLAKPITVEQLAQTLRSLSEPSLRC
ncbi:MAG: ATP-binding protein [Gemmatales bacterium]|nr:ATP-binding protein [Gemmatales bacterium]MCS7159806.1 ATP-binding protein [Gemmatales bacterium]MDW8175005.1 ATP-binding protein [Gemmatales bacterium]MDW8223473.1 ATP-binding protein [Gemmatales bacterium]